MLCVTHQVPALCCVWHIRCSLSTVCNTSGAWFVLSVTHTDKHTCTLRMWLRMKWHWCMVVWCTQNGLRTHTFTLGRQGEKMRLLFDWIKYLAVVRALTMSGCIENTYDVWLYWEHLRCLVVLRTLTMLSCIENTYDVWLYWEHLRCLVVLRTVTMSGCIENTYDAKLYWEHLRC